MEKKEMRDLPMSQPPPGWNPLEAQAHLQNKVWNNLCGTGLPLNSLVSYAEATDMGQLTDVVTENIKCIQLELAELLDRLPYKYWSARHRSMRLHGLSQHGELILESKYELVDAMHFLMNIAISLGMTWDELMVMYKAKNDENLRRQREGY